MNSAEYYSGYSRTEQKLNTVLINKQADSHRGNQMFSPSFDQEKKKYNNNELNPRVRAG